MVQIRATNFISYAYIDGVDSMVWYLKIDSDGSYRWYFGDCVQTELQAITRDQANDALRSFVAPSIKGDLVIVDLSK